jgi:hypothetical protein
VPVAEQLMKELEQMRIVVTALVPGKQGHGQSRLDWAVGIEVSRHSCRQARRNQKAATLVKEQIPACHCAHDSFFSISYWF